MRLSYLTEIIRMRKLLVSVLVVLALITIEAPPAQAWFFGLFGPTEGSGNLTARERNIENFKSIRLSGGGTVTLVPGSPGKVRVVTDDNLIQNYLTEVHGDRLELSFDDNDSYSPTSLKITVPVEYLEDLEIRGSGRIVSRHDIKGDRFNLMIKGSGDVKIRIDARQIVSEIKGSGEIDLSVRTQRISSVILGSGKINMSGKAAEHFITVKGSGKIVTDRMMTVNTNIEIKGSGSCLVNVEKNLKVDISGSGQVQYLGNPTIHRMDISGSGNVQYVGN